MLNAIARRASIRIIGIDPGLRHTGWGVIELTGNRLSYIGVGRITPDNSLTMALRLRILYEDLNQILDDYKPDHVAIEHVFVNNNAVSSLKLGQARGIGLLAAALKNLPVIEYAPNAVKKTVIGAGHAGKDQIYKMVKLLLPLAELNSNDEADALAIAICHAHHL